MLGKIITFTLILCGAAVVGMIGAPPCPITNHNGSIISGTNNFIQGTLVASSNGIVPLVEGQDSQCYNYSLPYAFMKVPEIAIGNSTLTQPSMILKVKDQTISSTT